MTAGHDLRTKRLPDLPRNDLQQQRQRRRAQRLPRPPRLPTRPCLLHSDPTLTNPIHSQRFRTATSDSSDTTIELARAIAQRVAYINRCLLRRREKAEQGRTGHPLPAMDTYKQNRPWTGRDFQGWEGILQASEAKRRRG